jgi:hypothetical protein
MKLTCALPLPYIQYPRRVLQLIVELLALFCRPYRVGSNINFRAIPAMPNEAIQNPFSPPSVSEAKTRVLRRFTRGLSARWADPYVEHPRKGPADLSDPG